MKGKMSHISSHRQEKSMVDYCEFLVDRPGRFAARPVYQNAHIICIERKASSHNKTFSAFLSSGAMSRAKSRPRLSQPACSHQYLFGLDYLPLF